MEDFKPNEIAFLDYLDGLDRADNLPDYWTLSYGVNTKKAAEKFIKKEFIVYRKDYYIALSKLTIQQLKDILKEHSLTVGGKKEVLIERILENVDIDILDNQLKVKNFYILTEKGKEFLKKNELCVLNIKNKYCFTDKEILNVINMEQPYSTSDKIWRIFQQRILDIYKKNNLYDLKYTYYQMADFLYNEKKFNISITYYIACFILYLSKIDNYSDIKNTYIDSIVIEKIKNCISLLDYQNIDKLIYEDKLCNNFKCFYNKEQLIIILKNCLNGEEYNYKKYKSMTNLNSSKILKTSSKTKKETNNKVYQKWWFWVIIVIIVIGVIGESQNSTNNNITANTKIEESNNTKSEMASEIDNILK